MNKFIVIEGLDGSGKSTAVKLLAERFIQNNLPCFTTCEPTKNAIGGLIRKALIGTQAFENEALALLFAADRYQHLQEEIIPALEHSNVICDRYYYSNMAYQGLCESSLSRVAVYNQTTLKPDVTFFLNVSPIECLRRVDARGNDISIYETLPELTLRYERYKVAIDLMKNDNIKVVGSDEMSASDIAEQIWGMLY